MKTEQRGNPSIDRAEVEAIIKRFAALPVVDDRSEDEILGHDENGLPS
ncbi:hypothetical protein [Mesorhizobium xinjiangense]|nr:hypothetical protein [Mesorhizobium xinjiangense]